MNHTSKHSRFFRIRSLKKCLVLSFALLIFALLAMCLYYIFGMVRTTQHWERKNFLELSGLAEERLEKVLVDSQNAAVTVGYSTACQRFLLSENPSVVIEAWRSAMETLNYAKLYGEGFKDIVLLGVNERKLSNTNSYRDVVEEVLALTDMKQERYFVEAFYSPVIIDRNSQYLIYIFPIYGNIDGYRYHYNPMTGMVIYDLAELLSLVCLDSYEDSAVVLLCDGEVLGSSRVLSEKEETLLVPFFRESEEEETSKEKALKQKESEKATSWEEETESEAKILDRQGYLLCRHKVERSSLELVFLLPSQKTHQIFRRTENVPLLLISCFLILILFLMVWLLKGLHHDINRLVSDIRRAENTEKQVHMPYIQELGPISEVLNKTFASLRAAHQREQSLMADKHEARLAQTQAEMLAYRSQITPHFLFNTLESMRSLAHHYGAEPIEGLISGMSQMFRYSLEAPQLVSLESELGHLDSYLSVMEIRFPKRYQIKKDIPTETLFCSLPSMSLQPLVENIMKYAFHGRINGMLLIQSFLTEDGFVVRIADNGIGMSEERLEEVRRWLVSDRSKEEQIKEIQEKEIAKEGANGRGIPVGLEGLVGKRSEDVNIGLANISRRLRLNFGEDARLEIRSKEDYYTVVELHVPFLKEERKNL